jgi:hypothetical protein
MKLQWNRIVSEITWSISGLLSKIRDKNMPRAPRRAPQVSKNVCSSWMGYPLHCIAGRQIRSSTYRMICRQTYRTKVLPNAPNDRRSVVLAW